MSHNDRHWSRPSGRTSPIRNFMGSPGAGTGPEPSAARHGVDTGYRVVDEHIQQGRDQARQRGGWPMEGMWPWGAMGNMGAMGDMSMALRPWLSLAEMWMRMWTSPGSLFGAQTGASPQGRFSPFFGPGPAQPPAGPMAPGPSPTGWPGPGQPPPGWSPLGGPGPRPTSSFGRPAKITMEVHSLRPVHIHLDLWLDDRASDLVIEGWDLEGVGLARDRDVVRVSAQIAEGQPAGRFVGHVVDARDRRPLGSIVVELLEA